MMQDILAPLPSLVPPVRRLLWVGVQPYTLRYEYFLASQGIEMSSIEMDGGQALYGSSQHHVIGAVQDCANHFKASSFDAVSADVQAMSVHIEDAPRLGRVLQAIEFGSLQYCLCWPTIVPVY